ncbi:MAG: alpha/beta hydrolase [Phycisphaerae bacterium]|nr:alpha/beta hydrolase [Phycisphaerae bacterium]
MTDSSTIFNREYGTAGPCVAVLHGGPGAPGYMTPVARELADAFRVLEPFQRGSEGVPLTVDRHVADLKGLLERRWPGERPSLVGHSWGAMLALCFAAAHPEMAGAVVLIGCGTFDAAARRQLQATRGERLGCEVQLRLEQLSRDCSDPDASLREFARVLQKCDSVDLIDCPDESEPCDARAAEQTWADMLRLQAEGVYPAAFASIRCPVRMLHGADDPHSGRLILAGLKPHIPHIEYEELARCGHYPWLERAARDAFYRHLRTWLAQSPG